MDLKRLEGGADREWVNHAPLDRAHPRALRQYRRSLAAHGQVSPLFVSDLVQPQLRDRSYADIGCGAGVPVSVFRARWPWTPAFTDHGIETPTFVGVDFSPRAVAYADRFGAYDRVVLAESADLPLVDGEVEAALSLENLEHLYPDEVVPAIRELARVARHRVIITTPWPWDVVNRRWLDAEIAAARNDDVPLEADELSVLAGCVHKSTLLPEQMAAAGFRCTSWSRSGAPHRHPVYCAEVGDLDLDRIGTVLGIPRPAPPRVGVDHRQSYAELLDASRALAAHTPRPKRRWRIERLLDQARTATAGA